MQQVRKMRDSRPGKIEQWANWTFWPATAFSGAAVAMLVTGASDAAWRWFFPVYLFVGMPTILQAFVSDWARLRRIWRYWRGQSDDWA